MLLIRDVFQCKPGTAKTLVKMFKETIAILERDYQLKGARVMTDVVANYWTVVFETTADDLGGWESQMSSADAARKPMEGYMDLVEGGHREIYRIE